MGKNCGNKGEKGKDFSCGNCHFYASLQRKEIRFNTISRYCD